jgi:hypothetical protein
MNMFHNKDLLLKVYQRHKEDKYIIQEEGMFLHIVDIIQLDTPLLLLIIITILATSKLINIYIFNILLTYHNKSIDMVIIITVMFIELKIQVITLHTEATHTENIEKIEEVVEELAAKL